MATLLLLITVITPEPQSPLQAGLSAAALEERRGGRLRSLPSAPGLPEQQGEGWR